MRKFAHVAMLAALAVWLGSGIPAGAATPVLVAANRCNSQTIDDASTRLREYDRRGTSGNSGQLLQRYGAIVDVVAVLNEERQILDSVCSSDAQQSPLFAQIAALSAWALVLEADIAAKLNASCGAAAQALPTMMLSDAWLALANVVNEQGAAVPTAFNNVIPRIQSRAQALGLALPAWAETSAYWRDQVHAKAKAALSTCPSPSPSASPS